jgi:hypothetical protein
VSAYILRPDIAKIARIAKKPPSETPRNGEKPERKHKGDEGRKRDCQNRDDRQESPKLKSKTYRGFTRMNADGKPGDPVIGRSKKNRKLQFRSAADPRSSAVVVNLWQFRRFWQSESFLVLHIHAEMPQLRGSGEEQQVQINKKPASLKGQPAVF